jgi:hypothetical protein
MGQMAYAVQFVSKKFECDDLLLISRQYDRLKVYFSHLVDTLHYLSSSSDDQDLKFRQLLPPNAAIDFANIYKLPTAFIFKILRSGLPQIFKQTEAQFAETVN